MIKRASGIIISSILAISLTACSTGDTSGGKKKIVYQTRSATAALKESIKKYEEMHPDIKIKLVTQVATDSKKPIKPQDFLESFNEYTTKLDTAIMASKGPDIIEMNSSLPLKYGTHNRVVDLTTMMDQDPTFKKEDYFTNILDGSKDSGGRLYSMPLGFGLDVVSGDQEAIDKTGVKIDDNTWTWNDFLNTADQLLDGNGKYPGVIADAPLMLLSNMIQSNPSLILDPVAKKAKFDSPEFKEIMTKLKLMQDQDMFNMDSYFKYQAFVKSPWDYLDLGSMFFENGKLYNYPHPYGTKGQYFNTYRNVAITTKSKVKPEAWDFIKFMMSEQATAAPERDLVDGNEEGIPINKQGLANQINKMKSDGTYKPVYATQLGESVKVDEGKLAEFESRIDEASLHLEQDTFITTLCQNEFNAYFTDQKSLDDVIKVLQDKVTTYLNE